MRKLKHKIEDRTLIHWEHPLMKGEYSLCGDDINGDDDLKIERTLYTCDDVTCQRCLEIVACIIKETK